MAFFAALVAAPIGAQQDKVKDEKAEAIPKSAYPPAGLCRVWLNGVAASQQPAATDCTSAIRNLPGSAKVLFGDMPGIPATPSSGLQVRSFEGSRGSWPEGRRQSGVRTRFATPPENAVSAGSSAAVRSAPVAAHAVTTIRPSVQPPQAKPAGKPERPQY